MKPLSRSFAYICSHIGTRCARRTFHRPPFHLLLRPLVRKPCAASSPCSGRKIGISSAVPQADRHPLLEISPRTRRTRACHAYGIGQRGPLTSTASVTLKFDRQNPQVDMGITSTSNV